MTRDRASGRKSWFRRHKVATGALTLVVIAVLAVGGWAWYLNSQVDKVPRIDAGVSEPPADEKAETRALNILLAGTDTRTPGQLAALVRDGWKPGAMRSDTIMLMHVTKERDEAYVVSVPRDTLAEIPGHGSAKINAAFSLGGPELYVDTMEAFTGLQVDHLAVIDWAGFEDLSTAVGGVDVTVPETITDTQNDITWEAGRHHLEGREALMYVRMRYGLGEGDFDRIKRQQNFMRSLLGELVARDTLGNPLKLTAAVRAITQNLTLDETFGNDDIRDLAFGLRRLGTEDITFLTVPLESYDTIDGQSVVLVDEAATRRLFAAVDADRLPQHVERNDLETLPRPGRVS